MAEPSAGAEAASAPNRQPPAGTHPGPQDSDHGIGHARVLRIAVPIMLANATVPILGAVDTGVVGQMGEAAPIGAVGVGAIVLASVYWVFGFLRMGTTGLAAQARGAGDAAETGAILTRALLIAAAGGLALIALQGPLAAAAFRIAPASDEVETLARGYLTIRIWGAPATIALFAITGWLIATERTRGVLVLQLVINGLNIMLDLWFVLGLGWGVQGVAVATLIAEYTGLALGLWLCRGAFASRAWCDRARLLDAGRLRRMVAVNTDIMIRTVLLQACMTAFVFIGAGFGDVVLAANQVLMQFVLIAAYAIDGFAFAAEALVGNAVGARSVSRLRRAGRLASLWGLGLSFLLVACFALAGPAVIDIMAKEPEVRLAAREFLPWVLVGTLAGLAAFMLDGIFIGATETRAMRNATVLSAAIFAVAVAGLGHLLGNHGLWASLVVLYLARAATLGLLYPAIERRVAAGGGATG